MKTTFIFCVGILLLFAGTAVAQSRIEWHPMPERIPHYNADHIAVPSSPAMPFPADFSFHRSVVEGHASMAKTTLDVLVSTPWMVDVVALSPTRLLFLDRDQLVLTEYDLASKSARQVAGSGRGPGDLFFPRELVQHGDKVYVPMGGFRITEFDCSAAPCKPGKTIPVEKVNPMSMGVMGDRFVAQRSIPITSNDLGLLREAGRASMAVIAPDGKVEAEFGQTYDFGTEMMLMDAFKDGFVRHDSKTGLSVLAFADFPILYAFDKDTKLAKTFMFGDFTLGRNKYDTVTKVRSIPTESYSLITQMQTPAPGMLLLEVMQRNMSKETADRGSFEWFVVNLATDASSKLGVVANDGPRIQFTKHGAVLFQDDEVYWIANK